MHRRLCTFLSLIIFSFLATGASAITLNWNNVTTWTNGSLSNSFDVDPASAGNDITVSVAANNGAVLQNMTAAPNQSTPAVTSAFQGGLGAIDRTLSIAVNLANTSQSVTVTMNFSAAYTAGVSNVSFTIFDIDYANSGGNTFQDQLSLMRGIALDGSLVAPTITTSSANTRTGTGINQLVTGNASASDTGAGSGNGNVTISFGSTAIRSLTFTYGGGPAFANPTYQHIGIHNISFTPVPEMNPALGSAFSCLAAMGFVLLRQRGSSRK